MNEWLYLTVPLRTGLFVLLGLDLWKRVDNEGASIGLGCLGKGDEL
jgi:hypothetical protein